MNLGRTRALSVKLALAAALAAPMAVEVAPKAADAATISSLVSIQNRGGRIEQFAVGSDRALWHRWQGTPGSSYSGRASLAGGFCTGGPAASLINRSGEASSAAGPTVERPTCVTGRRISVCANEVPI